MSSRSLRPCLVAGLTSLAACGLAPLAMGQETPPPPATTPAGPAVPPVDNELYGPIKLPAANLDLMLLTLEELTGRTILRPPALPPGEYNLVINRKTPKSEVIMAIETTLAMNQIGIAPLGDKFLKVVPLMSVRTEAPEVINGSSLELAPSGRIASKVFTLDFLRVNEFMPQIANMLNPQLGGPVIFDKTNAFLLTDSVSNLQRIERLLLDLDKPITANLTPKFYPLTSAKASDVVNKLRGIFQGPIQQQLGSATSFSPDDRTNQVILIADARQHPFFDDLIRKLDVKADPNTRNEVIYLKHAASKDVAALLSQVISGQTSAASKTGASSVRPGQVAQPGQPPAPAPGPELGPVATSGTLGGGTTEFSTLITVIADERSNAVVISGTADDVRLIRELVDKIDIILAQVRIEVVIADVTLNDNDTTGIQSLGLTVTGDKISGFAGGGAGLSVTNGTITRPGVVGSGPLDLAGTISLTATNAKSNVTVLANPTLVTTHNKEASIFVGESRPVFGQIQTVDTISDGTNTGTNPSALRSSITQQEAGINLKIKPLIGADGTVQLEIEQTFNAFGANVALGDDLSQPSINKREAKSFLNVRNDEIIVLGGYQSNTRDKSRSRLGPIPIIGDLLGQRSLTNTRTELMMFIRPHVIQGVGDTTADANQKIETITNPKAVRDTLYNQTPPRTLPGKPPGENGPLLRRPK